MRTHADKYVCLHKNAASFHSAGISASQTAQLHAASSHPEVLAVHAWMGMFLWEPSMWPSCWGVFGKLDYSQYIGRLVRKKGWNPNVRSDTTAHGAQAECDGPTADITVQLIQCQFKGHDVLCSRALVHYQFYRLSFSKELQIDADSMLNSTVNSSPKLDRVWVRLVSGGRRPSAPIALEYLMSYQIGFRRPMDIWGHRPVWPILGPMRPSVPSAPWVHTQP